MAIKIPITWGRIDPANVPGSKLVEIARAVLGMKPGDPEWDDSKYAGQYTDAHWLDERIEEVCNKGRI